MIGKKIAQLRTQHKLSQKELARRTGVSVATVKNWEGDSSDPCLENIKSLSNIFNVTTDSRLGQNENLRLYHEELEEADIVLLNQISSNTWSTRSTATCARGPRRIRAAAVPLRCRRLPALFLLCLLPGGRNLGLVFSNSLKAAIPWTRRRSAGAASAFSPPSPEEGTEYFIRKGIVPEAEREVYEYGFAITICTIASTLGLLLGQFLGGAVLIAIFYTCQSSGGGITPPRTCAAS